MTAFRVVILSVLFALLLPYAIAPLYRFVNPISTLMLWRWIRDAPVERAWTPLERISSSLPHSVIVAEDDRFCVHHGVDFPQLRQAIEAEFRGSKRPRGGSGITQQLAKNLFLWPGRSYVRKGLELPLALWIDLVIPKRRQIEVYLNIVEWGPGGEFGAEAAARRAFRKSALSLSPQQAAMMAAILPNPIRRDPAKPSPRLRQLASLIAARASLESNNEQCIRVAARVKAGSASLTSLNQSRSTAPTP
jgi:monofunctional biosynthetic peptidoglycan transglycosylase